MREPTNEQRPQRKGLHGPKDLSGTSTGKATALLRDAYVGENGRRASAQDGDAVHIYLMNVLQSSDTSFVVRSKLLEEVLAEVEPTGNAVLLTPAGYFGYDSPDLDDSKWLPRSALDRAEVLKYLHSLKLRPGLLLVVGIDEDRSHQALHVFDGAAANHREIVRERSTHTERQFSFGGLRFFGAVCGEVLPSGGPMTQEPKRFFDASRDIQDLGIDVVLNAAHRMVKCTQSLNAATNRFPFETFFRSVSRARAACFLAHHHPHAHHAKGGLKNHSYSDWGMYAGKGEVSDWMEVGRPVRVIRTP